MPTEVSALSRRVGPTASTPVEDQGVGRLKQENRYGICYGLHAVSPQIHRMTPSLQGDGIRSGAFWKVMRL